MNWFLTLLGLFWVFLGLASFIFTKTIKKYYSIFIKGNHPKAMGALALLVGALLLCCNPSGFYFVVFFLGLIQLFKGMYLIFAPDEKIAQLFNWWFNAGIVVYKIWGALTFLMGIILLAAR